MTTTLQSSCLVATYAPFPFTMVRAEGVWVYSSAGDKYLDFYGGHAVSLLGHSPSNLVDAISRQGKELYFYSTLGEMPIREKAARDLISYGPSDFTNVFFCNSGAEANENALKLSLQKRQRGKLVGFKKGWHGRSLLCMSVTDDPKWHASMPGWFGPTEWATINDEASLSIIDEDTAGVIIEPIQSIGGVQVASDNFLRALRHRCTEVGAWLIFDEIQTGLGRTGKPFVSGSCGVVPEMMTLAKGLGSGYPIGAVVMQPSVAATIQGADLGSTFGGGPMAMAVLSETMKTLKEQRLAEHAASIESYLREKLLSISEVEEVRGKGCLLGLKTKRPAKEIQQHLLHKKILAGTSGDPHVLRLLPPLVIQAEHVEILCAAFGE